MLHSCVTTINPVEYVESSDGRWRVEGLGSALYTEMVSFFKQILQPYNSTVHMTAEPKECLSRLSSNQSDVSTAFISIASISPDYWVPEATFAAPVQFLTGYTINEGEPDPTSPVTVGSNIDLLEPSVYLSAFVLLFSFVGLITTGVIIRCVSSSKERKMRIIGREIKGMIYRSSAHFRLITHLYCVLFFYMATSFLCLYKTSQVVKEKPFYPKSYEDSLNYRTSVAFFSDQFAVVSDGFKNAPKGTMKRNLWDKYISSGRRNDYSSGKFNFADLPQVMFRASEGMTVRKGILVTSALFMPAVRTALSMSSPPGKLWILKVLSDPMEREVIYGPAMRRHFEHSQYVSKRFRCGFESHIMAHLFDRILDVSETIGRLMPSSESHKWKQRVVNGNEHAFASHPQVASVSLFYFLSFFMAVITLWLIALIINLLEVSCCMANRKRRVARAR